MTENPISKIMEKYGMKVLMYVEYPHKSQWREDFGEDGYKRGLVELCNLKAPTLLYIHMPYCHKQCYFCTCRVEITSEYKDIHNYLQTLYKEIELHKNVFDKWGTRPNFKEIHFGGGTPTYINETDFVELMEKIRTICDTNSLAEISLEIDPRHIKRDRMKFYHEQGIDRISFGIQDFDLEVQKAVNRVQPASIIESLLTPEVREWFRNGINFDIICGLPNQTPETMHKTMEKVADLGADRVCLNYLDVSPKYAPHQLLMPMDKIPDAYERRAIFTEALNVLLSRGYIRTGYDHFAKPTDDLGRARKDGTMIWNSLGSTPGRCEDIIGLGVHSYSRLGPQHYSQNYYELEKWESAINAGRFPIFRGIQLSLDDIIRREIIQHLRAYFIVDKRQIEDEYNINFNDYFCLELVVLKQFVTDNFVELKPDVIQITEQGQQFANLVCRVFDIYSAELP